MCLPREEALDHPGSLSPAAARLFQVGENPLQAWVEDFSELEQSFQHPGSDFVVLLGQIVHGAVHADTDGREIPTAVNAPPIQFLAEFGVYFPSLLPHHLEYLVYEVPSAAEPKVYPDFAVGLLLGDSKPMVTNGPGQLRSRRVPRSLRSRAWKQVPASAPLLLQPRW